MAHMTVIPFYGDVHKKEEDKIQAVLMGDVQILCPTHSNLILPSRPHRFRFFGRCLFDVCWLKVKS